MYNATFKIIIFGDEGCGKETLTQRFLTNLFVSDRTMTIGVDFEVKSLTVDGLKVKLKVWDFGGEERLTHLIYLRSLFYEQHGQIKRSITNDRGIERD